MDDLAYHTLPLSVDKVHLFAELFPCTGSARNLLHMYAIPNVSKMFFFFFVLFCLRSGIVQMSPSCRGPKLDFGTNVMA